MYDIAVIGLGGMGSATLANVALRGKRVVGLEQFERGHELGASTGRCRMIRKAYFEDAAYVPLLLRAYDAWRELESLSHTELLQVTGVLMVGSSKCAILTGARSSARAHGIDYDDMTIADVTARFPMFAMRDGEVAVFEPDGGFVIPERAIEVQLALAESAGAETRFGVRALRWFPSPANNGLRVELDDGSTLDAARIALCAGPWTASIARGLGVPLVIQRNVQHWFEPQDGRFALGRCPSFLSDRDDQPGRLYGFPDYGYGVKAAFHGYGERTTPEALDREIHDDDVAAVRDALEGFLPGAAGRYRGGKACMYTLTPDEHFVIAAHPCDERAIVAAGFSGHGFKFAPVVGEIVADLLLEGGTDYDIGFLSPARFPS